MKDFFVLDDDGRGLTLRRRRRGRRRRRTKRRRRRKRRRGRRMLFDHPASRFRRSGYS